MDRGPCALRAVPDRIVDQSINPGTPGQVTACGDNPEFPSGRSRVLLQVLVSNLGCW